MRVKQWIVAASIAAAGACAWALPSVQDVESAVRQGQYAQAETMMKEVVDAKPNSARGHYLYAEILAHNGRFAQASTEANAAARIDPALGFTQPDKFRTFQETLAREQRSEATRATATAARTAPAAVAPAPAPAREVEPQRSSGLPGWIWLVGLAVVGYALWRGFSRSRAAASVAGGAVAPAGYAGGAPNGPGYAPGYGQQPPPGYGPAPGGYGPGYAQPQSGNRGSWVGTGLAAAGGVAAGVALDRMLRPGESGHAAGFGGDPASAGDLGRMSNFDNAGGAGGNEAARELEDRSIDFGTGGNDWGGDAGGGSFDGGGSSDDGGGGGWD